MNATISTCISVFKPGRRLYLTFAVLFDLSGKQTSKFILVPECVTQ